MKILASHYIRNVSEKKENIILLKSRSNTISSFNFPYTKEVMGKLKYDTFNQMSDSLNTISENGVIILPIPSKSILYLGESSSLLQMFDKVIIESDTIAVFELRFKKRINVTNNIRIESVIRYAK